MSRTRLAAVLPLVLALLGACGREVVANNPPGLYTDGGLPKPQPDAGSPVADAGSPVADAGSPVADAGSPGTDAGSPGTDAGSPRTDGGSPVADAGTGGGSQDGGSPGTDAGISVPFSAANWNIEWFGETTQGPSDEALQLSNVEYVISSAGLDFWALQEVVSPAAFDALKQQLPGYDGFLASDASRVLAGSSYYTLDEQKLAVLFRSDIVSVRRAEVILTAYNYDFASRPPLRVDLTVTRNGTRVDLVAILLHLKAFTSFSDYSRRLSAAAALKSYLDTHLPNTPVLVLGDWNDDVDVSISYDSTAGAYRPTPFQNFVDAAPTYSFVTRPLSLAGVRSTVSGSQFIDHQLATRPLAPALASDSPQVLRPAVPSYSSTTSDHYPVLSRFELGRVGRLQEPFPEVETEALPPAP